MEEVGLVGVFLFAVVITGLPATLLILRKLFVWQRLLISLCITINQR